MASRKIKGTTIYPPVTLRSRVEQIAAGDDGSTFNYWAVKLMKMGLARYDRKRERREQKRKLQTA